MTIPQDVDFYMSGSTSRWVMRRKGVLREVFDMRTGVDSRAHENYYGDATQIDVHEFAGVSKLGPSIVYSRRLNAESLDDVRAHFQGNTAPDIVGRETSNRAFVSSNRSARRQIVVSDAPRDYGYAFLSTPDPVWDSAAKEGWGWATARVCAASANGVAEVLVFVGIAPGQGVTETIEVVATHLENQGFDWPEPKIELYDTRINRPDFVVPNVYTIERESPQPISEYVSRMKRLLI